MKVRMPKYNSSIEASSDLRIRLWLAALALTAVVAPGGPADAAETANPQRALDSEMIPVPDPFEGETSEREPAAGGPAQHAVTEPQIPFAPYGPTWKEKPDLAQVESRYPVARAELNKVTVKHLRRYTQEQIDQLFARLSSGPLPDGYYEGRVLAVKGGLLSRMAETTGYGVLAKIPVEQVAGVFWQGKRFLKQEGVSLNWLEMGLIRRGVFNWIAGKLGAEVSRQAGTRTGVLRSERRYEIFPAKNYCGQSLIDSRRESIVIDYMYADDLTAHYKPNLDFLPTRKGMRVRDELRMVRPGLYLGRAYLNRIFLANFVLYNETEMKKVSAVDECWSGTQVRGVK